MHTPFTSAAAPALAAPVTEVAFFTVEYGAREDAKVLIGDEVVDRTHPVITVGKSLGGAISWGESNRVVSDPVSYSADGFTFSGALFAWHLIII